MKKTYTSPTVMVEVLEKIDVLLSSGGGSESPYDPANAEWENRYRDFASFVFTGGWQD